ncbi:hypothetical protein BFP77_04690 [Maribacter sp. 4U21]|uniref:hypothetical protein n=1 Tax=Maribacter sp. 4U21 TaxID=1889779 RepID=UPI000C147FE5|nr:hypothetical protein [Maribacter sp. 4U21]PIB29926.1 hypothetical protein BFP77_04690 [Maribacter sp. 4U21]
MELIIQDNYSGAVAEELLTIKNQKALSSFFAKINRTRKPGLPVPVVDFTKDYLIVWCAGEAYSQAPALVLKKETDKELVFKKKRIRKKTAIEAVVSPFSIYKLPIREKKIVLE